MNEGYAQIFYKMLWAFHFRLLNLERVMLGHEYSKRVEVEWNKVFDDGEESGKVVENRE